MLDGDEMPIEGAAYRWEADDYPWRVGGTYRFEVTWEELDGGIAVTDHVTELATMRRRFLGVLWGSQPLRRAGTAAFVEDFRRTAPTCLAQEVRSAAFRRAGVRTTDGGRRPIRTGRLTRNPEDWFSHNIDSGGIAAARIVRTYADIEAAREDGDYAVMWYMQRRQSRDWHLEGDVANLRRWYDRGLRVLSGRSRVRRGDRTGRAARIWRQ